MMSPVERHGIFALPLNHVSARWLSSNAMYVVPDGSPRVNARYKNTLLETGSLTEYASRMLFLPGVDPPFCVAKFQLPGSFSLPSLPPAKMLSLRFGSGLWFTPATFCQSVRGNAAA